MISKKKLRERLIDICNGAGLVWIEGDEYFEAQEGSDLECYGRIIQAVERTFGLPDSSRLRTPWNLKEMDDLDKLVELVHNAIEYDCKPA